MKNLIVASKTYDIVTPESAEYGDFSESWFLFENNQYDSIEDFLSELNNDYWEFDSFNKCFRTIDADQDLSDGSETYYSIHLNKITDKQLSELLNKLK